MRDFVSRRIASVPPSGIRRFFDIAATMDDVVSLGIGEPDFVTPEPILRAGIKSLEQGKTHYTSNSGIPELREALAEHLKQLYDVA
ncbi:MAG: pyridoxal phosphate-dependent aminotransferase, partial [Anaerolineales bacterium]|nr:pyridoxal phosphate-dependent aminotransferase [Anaerolineales bacterium]